MVYSFSAVEKSKYPQVINQKKEKQKKKQTKNRINQFVFQPKNKNKTKMEISTTAEDKVYKESNAEKLLQGHIWDFAGQTTYLNKSRLDI